jgi:hypothetical protein
LLLTFDGKTVRSRDVAFKRSDPPISTTPSIEPLQAEISDTQVAIIDEESTLDDEPPVEVDNTTDAQMEDVNAPEGATNDASIDKSANIPPPRLEVPISRIPRRSPRNTSTATAFAAVKVFMTGNSDAVVDPITYKQAIYSPQPASWKDAMQRELVSVDDTGT